MNTTTSYGTWNNHVDSDTLTVEQAVVEALGDFWADYDTEALAAAYRDAINEALPAGVSLCGNEFIGPYSPEWGGPLDDDGRLDIKAIVTGIDFWEIAAQHETAAV